MHLIIGLGNPGQQYLHTRHNIGFLVIDELAKRTNTDLHLKRALEAEVGETELSGRRTLLCKPQTFMNVSGRALQKVMSKYPIEIENILVIYDDADLPFGTVKTKTGGSSAGHRGMQSILDQFPSGTQIARVRMGIGRSSHPDVPLDEFVLQRWTSQEERLLPDMIETAVKTALTYA